VINALESMWKESAMAQFDVLSWHFPVAAEDSREISHSASQFLG
jgi:hypothetical protein